MKRIWTVALVLLLVPPLFPGCGKKGPPTLPRPDFTAGIEGLAGRWEGHYVVLEGGLTGVSAPGDPDRVQGARVYYGAYDPSAPPCEGCPVRYHGYHEFGPEVLEGGGFRCRVPGKRRENLYFFKVHLLGPEGEIGPPSDRARVSSGDG